MNRVSADRRPALLALSLLSLFVLILLLPVLRDFFALAALSPAELGIVALAGLLWMLVMRATWHLRLMDRFLGMHLSP